MKAIQYIFIAITFSIIALPAQAQIGDLKKELKSSKSSSKKKKKSSTIHFNSNILEELVFSLMERVFVFTVKSVIVGLPGERFDIDMTRYPYYDRKSGLYLSPGKKGYKVRASANIHYLKQGDILSGGFVKLKFSPKSALTIDLSHLQLLKSSIGKQEDINGLSFSSFSVNYNRFRHKNFHIWGGLGIMRVSSLEEGYTVKTTPTFSAGFTWYIKKPISLYSDVQFGSPDGASKISQTRIQGHFKRMMIYAGRQSVDFRTIKSDYWIIGTGVFF